MKVELYVNPLNELQREIKIKKYWGDMHVFIDSVQKVSEDLFGNFNDDYESFLWGLILYRQIYTKQTTPNARAALR